MSTEARTVAVILGAGKSTRLGGGKINKVLLLLAGEPMIVRVARTFATQPVIHEVIVVAASRDVPTCVDALRESAIAADVIPGGPTRHASEWKAMQRLAPRIERGELDVVVIHDAARPLYRGARLAELVNAAREIGGAILALPMDPAEELAWIRDGQPIEPATTEGMWRAQTPQAFHAGVLLDAFLRAEEEGFEGTDTASTVERAGVPVRVLLGDPFNIKVTQREDLLVAESFLKEWPSPDPRPPS